MIDSSEKTAENAQVNAQPNAQKTQKNKRKSENCFDEMEPLRKKIKRSHLQKEIIVTKPSKNISLRKFNHFGYLMTLFLCLLYFSHRFLEITIQYFTMWINFTKRRMI